jgi:cobaltochelatase CobN
MADAALIFACTGCCCGHPRNGGPKAHPRLLRAAARRVLKASGLAGRVRLTFTGCLGPCSEANVVFLYLPGRPLWLRRMNFPELFVDLLAYSREVIEGRATPLPGSLASRAFVWTGGGVGPEPPVVDVADMGPEARRAPVA